MFGLSVSDSSTKINMLNVCLSLLKINKLKYYKVYFVNYSYVIKDNIVGEYNILQR